MAFWGAHAATPSFLWLPDSPTCSRPPTGQLWSQEASEVQLHGLATTSIWSIRVWLVNIQSTFIQIRTIYCQWRITSTALRTQKRSQGRVTCVLFMYSNVYILWSTFLGEDSISECLDIYPQQCLKCQSFMSVTSGVKVRSSVAVLWCSTSYRRIFELSQN